MDGEVRAQGAIEYLLIISAAIIIVAVVIIALGGILREAKSQTDVNDYNNSMTDLSQN